MRRGSLFRWAALLVAWGLVAYLALMVGTNVDDHQWDFETYYVAAKAFASGANPYDVEERAEAAGRFSKYPFVYPPLVLYALLPFAKLSYETAFVAWWLLKLAALGLLLRVWHRHFTPIPAAPAMLILLALAYNGALFQDLLAGNLAIFEQLGVWLALAALLQGQAVAFGVVLGLAAQIKLVPALLLFTALVLPPRPRWRAFATGVATFTGLLALNLVHRERLPDFVAAVQALGRGGPLDPSSYSLVEYLRPHFMPRPNLDATFYAALATLFAAVGAWALLRLRAWPAPDPRLAVLLATSVYALVLPRLKGYSYIVLIPAALHVLRAARVKVPLVAVLVALPLRGSLLPFTEYVRLAYLFFPWIAAVYVLFELAREATLGARRETLESRSP